VITPTVPSTCVSSSSAASATSTASLSGRTVRTTGGWPVERTGVGSSSAVTSARTTSAASSKISAELR